MGIALVQITEGDDEYQQIVDTDTMPIEEADRRVTVHFSRREHGGAVPLLDRVDKYGKKKEKEKKPKDKDKGGGE